ncbi:MAG: hypothetical protein E4H00_06140 [Myxococcales bacterium]|nr:MAG: hypothetical protein E4H00_06140 [Myxococcales bacterium]
MLMLAEGAFDALLLHQECAGLGVTFAGLPGVTTWKKALADSKARTVIVGFDADMAGDMAAHEALLALGQRGVRVRPVAGKDWCDYAAVGGDVASVVREALSERRKLFTIGEAFDRLRKLEAQPSMTTGFASMDAKIGGFKPGQLVVPLAPSGVGKTSFLVNLCYHWRDRKVLVLSLELMAGEFARMLARVCGYHNPLAEPQDLFPGLRIYDENTTDPERIGDLVADYADEVGGSPDVVMIDYLGYLARGGKMGSLGEYDRMSRTVMELKALAKKFGCVVVAPSQVNRSSGSTPGISSARGSGVVEESADFLIGLSRPMISEERELDNGKMMKVGEKPDRTRLVLSLLKSRHGYQGFESQTRFGPLSLTIVEESDPDVALVHREITEYERGTSWFGWHKSLRERAASGSQQTFEEVADDNSVQGEAQGHVSAEEAEPAP